MTTLNTLRCYAKEQPTIDAEIVVRCKQCMHWGTGIHGETEHVKQC